MSPSSSRSGANRRSDACDDRRRVAPQENEDERAERHQRRARLEDRTHADPLPDAGRKRRSLAAATKGEAGRISKTKVFGDAASSPPSRDSGFKNQATKQSHRSAQFRPAGRAGGGFRREVQPRRQHWFLNEKSGFPFRTPAFCSVSKGQRRLGEKEYRAPSVTQGVALRVRTQEAGFEPLCRSSLHC